MDFSKSYKIDQELRATKIQGEREK